LGFTDGFFYEIKHPAIGVYPFKEAPNIEAHVSWSDGMMTIFWESLISMSMGV
jgi:hypothetical protein